jgi:predicted ATPase/class 3 adenylate cyclase/DNA-binding NarL/FixJ family response regulator
MPRPDASGRLLTALPSGTLTFLISDIEESTQAWDRSPDAMRKALELHDAILERTISANKGNLVELGREGDSILCVFARPSEAVACALAAQLEFLSAAWPEGTDVRIRMAIHTGEAELRDGHYFGPALYRCARLVATAHGTQTIMSGPTHDLVVDSLPDSVTLLGLGVHRLKDLSRPERVFQLMHPGLPSDFPPLRSLDLRLTNLPIELTSFLGRETEISELKQLLTKDRLVTISGAGGLGKTRLALHLAADLIDGYPDGVWLVELGALFDPSLVAQAVAKSVGIREIPGIQLLETVTANLRTRDCLLVLDNCEHLIAECAKLAAHLLGQCPRLTILATSRERLAVPGEELWRLAPLSLPPAPEESPQATAVTDWEAVRLFIERARLDPRVLDADSAQAAAVVQICRRLDGIPLAIELAAARVSMMKVDELLRRLDDRFQLLTGGGPATVPRHQALRATVDWSFQLLEPGERALLRRLSIFAGGFAVADVEAVCAGGDVEPGKIIDLLGRLVDKSLVTPALEGEAGSPMRLLETLRQYSRERLDEASEADTYSSRHADHYLELAEHTKNLRDSHEHSTWLDRLENEHDNLRAALEWSLSASAGVNLRLAAALVSFWDARGYLTEGRDWLEKALFAHADDSAPSAEAFGAAGWLAQRLGDLDGAAAHLENSIRIARLTQQSGVLARSLRTLALVRLLQGDSQTAGPLVREAIDVAEGMDDQIGKAGGLLVIALVSYLAGDRESARTHAEESLALHRSLGDEKVAAFLLACMANLALDHDDEATARANLREGLEISRELREKVDVAFVLDSCARLAAAQSDHPRALQLAGAASAVRETVGALPAPPWEAMVAMSLEPARRALGRDAAQAAWKSGIGLTLEQAIEHALGWLAPDRAKKAVATASEAALLSPLSTREREIAALVGRGLRNREIAGKLHIAQRTVDAHVEHIRNKLDFHSRAQIAAWASTMGLIKD